MEDIVESNREKFLKLVSDAPPSKWLEESKWRIENRAWLNISFRIALKILIKLREINKSKNWLAKETNISIEDMNLIVKGQSNMTLETISKIEKVLKIKLIEII